MAWSSFGALPCRGKKTCWQLASRCCWNCARPWHASELVSFLVGLRTYRHPGTENQIYQSKPRFIHKMSLHEVTLSWLCRLVGSENRCGNTLQPSSGCFPRCNHLQGIFHFATIFTLQPSPADFPFYFHTNMFIGFYETLTPRSP